MLYVRVCESRAGSKQEMLLDPCRRLSECRSIVAAKASGRSFEQLQHVSTYRHPSILDKNNDNMDTALITPENALEPTLQTIIDQKR